VRSDLQRLTRDAGPATSATVRGPSDTERKASWVRTPAAVAGALALAALLALLTRLAFVRAPGAAIDSIAVLPFANTTRDPDAEYLSDGVTESLINNLSQLPLLRVAARSTVFRYKGREADPQQIGRDLRVRAVLSGRLLRRGETLIVRTELIDVTDGSQIWGGQYNRTMSEVFALQDDLSLEISEKLRLRLTTQEKQQLRKRHTANTEAYELYLKGRYEWNKRSPEALRKAADYFQQAVDKDPAYALAYGGLADTYSVISFFNVIPAHDAMPRAKAWAAKALAIDDELADADISLGYASVTYDWDWAAARQHFDQAMALNPGSVRYHPFYPFFLTVGGRSGEAIRVARRAFDRDPVSAAASHTLAAQLQLARQFDAAIQQCRNTIELDPKYAAAYEVMGASFAAKGMHKEAGFERAVLMSPPNSISLAFAGYARASLGERGEARRILEQLTVASKERYVPSLALAIVHVGLGEKDQAFARLEQSYAERFNRLAYLRVDAVWDPLRADARFDDLLRRIGLPR
jgi:TolB-like protein/Tfp pilus assembly protein PilF